MRVLYFLVVLCCLSLNCIAKSDLKLIDSLKNQIIAKNVSETDKCIAYNMLCDQVKRKNPSQGLVYAIKALDLSQKVESKKLEASSYNNIGMCYEELGNYDSCIFAYQKCLLLREELNDSIGVATARNNIGISYKSMGKYELALNNLMSAIPIWKKYEKHSNLSSTYSNIGSVFDKIGNSDKALLYYSYTLELDSITGYRIGMISTLNNIGIIFKKLNKLDKALINYHKALKIAKELDDDFGIAMSLNNIGRLYSENNDHQRALDCYNEAMPYFEKIGHKFGVVASLINISTCYSSLGKHSQAVSILNKALQSSKEMKSAELVKESLRGLFETFAQKKDFKSAFEFVLEYNKINDSLLVENNLKNIAEMEAKYQNEKKQLEIKKLEREKEIQNADIEKQKVILFSVAGGLILSLIMLFLIIKSYRQKKAANEIILLQKAEVEMQRGIAEEKRREAEHQKEIVEEKNQEILDSITYAKRLQDAILPPLKLVKQNLENSFILYKPKDIVAGDFYWMEVASVAEALEAQKRETISTSGTSRASVSDVILFAAADCTGHGVPGAMVSVVCSNALNRAVKEFGITEPGRILDKVTDLVIETFEKSEAEVKDGMDISLCSIRHQVSSSRTNAILQWAGANNPLWIVRSVTSNEVEKDEEKDFSTPLEMTTDESQSGTSRTSVTDSPHISHLNTQFSLQEIKADKQPIGKYSDRNPFTTHTIELTEGDSIYIFSDGYADQFGGEKGKKFKSSKMKELILSIQSEPMEKQRQIINDAFENWKGNLEQIDDVCIIGVRI